MHDQTHAHQACCGALPRRAFLADLGMGFTGLALGAMLHGDGIARGEGAGRAVEAPHFPPRAKSVIWVFCSGGYSHLETFDPKPALNQYAGKTFAETPYPDPFQNPLHEKRNRAVLTVVRDRWSRIMPLQVGYGKHGESGIEVSDWWPHLAKRVDDIAFVRNMYTTDNDHAAENQMHTGRHRLDETQPAIGAWIHRGLGTLNENLPQFVALGGPTRADTRDSIHGYYLGAEHDAVPLELDPKNPLPFGVRSPDILAEEQQNEFALIDRLNRLAAVQRPRDATLQARLRSYELAYRMQMSAPEALDFSNETAETISLYAADKTDATGTAGKRLLAARRLVERGVRFVQVYPTNYGAWDSHRKLKGNHELLCGWVDQPVAALLTDLKRRGLWNDVVVVFCTEFGRTPAIEERAGGTDGRDHHPHGFTVWLAGAGLKGGMVHGATDELGFHAVDPGHYVTDLHATVLHLLGLDGRRLEVPGRKRLDIDRGQLIHEILA